MTDAGIPYRQIRAVFDSRTIRVYQAYSGEIADAALKRGTFVSPPFKMERMTWIKPSFLWMMYRSGWATKPGQERVLAIDITREGFEWALANSCLSTFVPTVHGFGDAWQTSLSRTSVRIQWDPERDLRLAPLSYRSIQIGLKGPAVRLYVQDWIKDMMDITALAHRIRDDLLQGSFASARNRLPPERPYPLSTPLARAIYSDSSTR